MKEEYDVRDVMSSGRSKEIFVAMMRARTKAFAMTAIGVFRNLSKSGEARIIGDQFLRSSLSVASNYRAVCRARSKAEFYAKLSITIEELDESLFWMEILVDSGIVPKSKISNFEAEGQELLAILAKARKSTK